MDRARPEYDAMGVRLGSFLAYPKLGVHIGYDDDILAEDSDHQDDSLLTLAPSLLLESNWSRHALSLGAHSSAVGYRHETDEDHFDWGLAGKGRLDILDSMDLRGSINFQNLTEDRSAIDAVRILRKPTEYDQFDVDAVLTRRFNRLSLSIGGGLTDLDYDDSRRVGGGDVDQDFRDRRIVRGVGEVGYMFSPGYNLFARGIMNDRKYEDAPPVVSLERDSDGYQLVAGITSSLSNLIAGEFYLGYISQDYDSGAVRDVDGLAFGLDLEWYVTELTTFRAKASRSVVDSTSPGTGGILYSAGGIGFDHELMRQLLLQGDVVFDTGDWEGIDREDDGVRVGLGIVYLLSRRAHVELSYKFDDRDSNVPTLDYRRNRVSFGVEFQH